MSTNRISFTRGDTAVFDFTVKKDGALADLTSVLGIWLTVKADYATSDANKLFQLALGTGIVVLNPSGGTFRATFAPSNSASLDPSSAYVWDVQIKQADGSINTPAGLTGLLSVTADVYNAVA